MSKFKFRFEAILKLKEQIEEIAKSEYGREQKILEEEKQKLNLMNSKLDEYYDKMNFKSKKVTTPKELREYSVYISSLKEGIEFQKESINKQLEIVDKYREKLIESTKERKIYSKLKEKQQKYFNNEQKIIEGKYIDGIVSYKYTNEK